MEIAVKIILKTICQLRTSRFIDSEYGHYSSTIVAIIILTRHYLMAIILRFLSWNVAILKSNVVNDVLWNYISAVSYFWIIKRGVVWDKIIVEFYFCFLFMSMSRFESFLHLKIDESKHSYNYHRISDYMQNMFWGAFIKKNTVLYVVIIEFVQMGDKK